MTKKARLLSVRALLAERRDAVEKAVLVIYERQTATEQMAGQTVEHNGVGFSAFDAEILSSFAKEIQADRFGRPMGQRLSPRQFEVAKKRIQRYAGQLASIVAQNEAKNEATA